MGILDEQTIEIPCEACGRKVEKTIGWIKRHSNFTCSCGTVINLKADGFRREIAKVERSVAELARSLKNIGK